MRIAVVGQGYVGSVGAVCLAEAGHDVVGIEANAQILEALCAGRSPIYEPGLQGALAEQLRAGRLSFARSLDEVAPPECVLIAVGSPPLPSGGVDLRQVEDVIESVIRLEPLPNLIVLKSTVPPGTSEQLLANPRYREALAGRFVVSPEFLSQGNALAGWREPSRIVVGCTTPSSVEDLVGDLYRQISGPWIVTTPTNAEMVKYASNAYLATKISFVNEIANLCDDVGADIEEVTTGLSLDPRIGPAFLRPGVGYGGSCFPKDTQALMHLSSLRGRSMPLLQAVVLVNASQRLRVVREVIERSDDRSMPIAVLGLAFKPGTDDIREAPSITVLQDLVGSGRTVRAWDPVVPASRIEALVPGVTVTDSLSAALGGAGSAILMTEWPEIVGAPWADLAASMNPPRLVVDGRNCVEPAAMAEYGYQYVAIGRRAASPSHNRGLGSLRRSQRKT